MDRRGFLVGLGSLLVTAPAIVRAGSLMAVRVMPAEEVLEGLVLGPGDRLPYLASPMDITEVVRKAFFAKREFYRPMLFEGELVDATARSGL